VYEARFLVGYCDGVGCIGLYKQFEWSAPLINAHAAASRGSHLSDGSRSGDATAAYDAADGYAVGYAAAPAPNRIADAHGHARAV
jgi:hypothetical protein